MVYTMTTFSLLLEIPLTLTLILFSDYSFLKPVKLGAQVQTGVFFFFVCRCLSIQPFPRSSQFGAQLYMTVVCSFLFVFLEVPLDHINLILRGTRDGSIRPLRTFSLMLISNRTSSITCISPVRVYIFLVFLFGLLRVWFISLVRPRKKRGTVRDSSCSVCVCV